MRLALLLLLVSLTTVAAELKPLFQDQELGVLVTGASFPANVDKELSSGLTNRILIRVALLEGVRPIDQRGMEIAIRYDLWEENFAATLAVDGAIVETRTYRSLDEVRAFLAAIAVPRLFPAHDLRGTKSLTLRAELLLNPVERERMESIRKWVAENSEYVPIPPVDAGPGGLTEASMSNAIFNRIFEQYARGSDVAAVWQQTLASAPFTPGASADERK